MPNNNQVRQGLDGLGHLFARPLADEYGDGSLAQGGHVLRQVVKPYHTPLRIGICLQEGDDAVDPGIEHHDVPDAGMGGEYLFHGLPDLNRIRGMNEGLDYFAAGAVLGQVIQEAGASSGRRIGLAVAVWGDADDEHPLHGHP